MRSRGVDLTAVTAWEALKGPLRYGGVLEGLERADLWGVWTRREGGGVSELAKELVSRTSVFVNPNKHGWRVWAGESESEEGRGRGAWILVWALDDTEGRAALAALRSSGFEEDVDWVAKATLWTLRPTSSAAARALEIAEEIAVAKGRSRGLLANPHIHRWTCGLGCLRLGEALVHLGRESRGERTSSVSQSKRA